MSKLGLSNQDDNKTKVVKMRAAFVQHAEQVLCGREGSSQNLKEIYNYTDTEWVYIWSLLRSPGTWEVPDITDDDGKVVKLNQAPEMMLLAIADYLQADIVVFDLHNKTVQRNLANSCREGNKLWRQPLLLYYNRQGTHYQSLLSQDTEGFVSFSPSYPSQNTASADHAFQCTHI